MPGFISSITNSEDAVFAGNADFTSLTNQNPLTTNGLQTNGQLWIGSTVTNVGGTHINRGVITSPDASITVGYSSPNITLVANSTSTFAPNTTVNLFDDFIQNNIGFGQLQWRNSQVTDQINGTAAHPGLLRVTDGASAGIHLDENSATFPFILGGATFSLNFVLSLATLSSAGNRYTCYVGLMDDFPLAPSDGVYFSYSDNVNSGKWLLNCTKASVTTSVDTGIAAGTGYVNLGIQVNAAGTSVTATINGTAVGTPIATNIPIVAIGPEILWLRSTGALPSALIDLFYLTYVMTTPR
jgi:hypothetical protein